MRSDGRTDVQTERHTNRYNEIKRPRKAFATKEAGVIGNKLLLLVY